MKNQIISLVITILCSCSPILAQKPDSVKILKDSISVLNAKYQKVNNEKKDAVSTLAQIIYYEKIINRKPTQKKYEHGWITRALKYYNLPTTKN
jgi:CII-binding regulator of phage lambda lysogenization HflD